MKTHSSYLYSPGLRVRGLVRSLVSLRMGFPRSRVMVGHDGLWRVRRTARVRAKPAKAPADGRGAETHRLESRETRVILYAGQSEIVETRE